jgi:N-acetylmuramoyl-L-alanine amidase
MLASSALRCRAHMRWRTIISRDVALGTFSNIKTPLAARKPRAATQPKLARNLTASTRQIGKLIQATARPRYMAHAGLLVLAAFLVLGNDPSRAHALSVRLLSAQVGAGSTLDEIGQASVAADMATKSNLMVTTEAAKTATLKNEQVALLTATDTALAKRQVVSTAGNATRDVASYVVESGDTLSGVARKYNITTATLKWANDLDDADAIKPGQTLAILPVSGLLYTVKDGDTAESLAQAYHANAAQILSYNDAEIRGLTAGTKIIIPDGVKAEAPKPTLSRLASNLGNQVLGAVSPRLTYYAGTGGGYIRGYCTYYVASRRRIPSNWGNANSWYYNAQASGFSVGSTPVAGAVAWTGAGYYGHVAYVESVSGSMVTVSEMNYNGNWNRVTSRTVPASSFRYIY